ncbi:MAG: cation transporter, partial [Candidatus Latescibacterota bacterium]
MTEQNTHQTTLAVRGMSCAACVARVEKALSAIPGVVEANVNFATHEASVRFQDVEISVLTQAVENAGYEAQVASGDVRADQAERDADVLVLRNRFVVGAVLSGLIMVVGMTHMMWGVAIASWQIHALLFVLATPVQFWCGWQFLKGAWSITRHGSADMNSLIAVGTLAAYGYSSVATFAHPKSAEQMW